MVGGFIGGGMILSDYVPCEVYEVVIVFGELEQEFIFLVFIEVEGLWVKGQVGFFDFVEEFGEVFLVHIGPLSTIYWGVALHLPNRLWFTGIF